MRISPPASDRPRGPAQCVHLRFRHGSAYWLGLALQPLQLPALLPSVLSYTSRLPNYGHRGNGRAATDKIIPFSPLQSYNPSIIVVGGSSANASNAANRPKFADNGKLERL